MNFPYEWINKDNLKNKELPEIKDFYSSIKLKIITKEEYNQTKKIYDKLEFKNIKEYLDTYLKLDITLLYDIFENFRKGIWDKFGLDCSKYIFRPSLTKDCILKFSGVKSKLKENYESSGKLINHLGSDENNYLSFEMYKLLLNLGYDIEI